MTADAGAPRATRTRRQRKPVVLLRPVPGDSVIHRLWAGSKLLLVAGIGVLMTFYPGWVPIGAVAASGADGGMDRRGYRAARCRRFRAGCGSCCFSAA